RTNLMLGWMHEIFPDMKIVLLIRHPFSVVQSYLNLGWGIEPCGPRREIDILSGQACLLKDYAEIAINLSKFNRNDSSEVDLLQLCILNYVPLKEEQASSFYIVFYERMLSEPITEIERLFSHLGLPFDTRMLVILKKLSMRSYSR